MRDRLYKRGGTWWARVPQPGGGTKRQSTHCADHRAAEAAYKRLEREASGAPHLPSDQTPRSVSEALKSLVANGCGNLAAATVSMYDQKSGHLRRLMGEVDVNDLTLDEVKKYIADRLLEGAARETVRKELVTLRRALEVAKEEGYFLAMPRALIPVFKVRYSPRRRWLTGAETMALLAVLKPHRQLWVVLAVYTGGRDSEVDALEWSDINFTHNLVRLDGTKTDGAARTIPLAPALKRVLLAMAKRQGRQVGVIAGEWLNVRRDLMAACKRAKIEKATPNDLRRTYASWLKQKGVDSFVVAQLLGHSTSRMVELVYGKLDQATFQSAAALLPGGCAPGVPDSAAPVSPVSLPSTVDPLAALGSLVPNPGIEPGTRGFSVRTPESMATRQRRKLRAV